MPTAHSPPPRGAGGEQVPGVPLRLQGQGLPPDVPRAPGIRNPDNPTELTLQDIFDAHERSAAQSRSENRALQAEIEKLRAEMFDRAGAPSLKAFGSVHDLPLLHSKSSFDAYTLKKLPVDIDTLLTVPTPLLETGEHKFVRAVNARKGYKFKPDYRSPAVQDGITIALEKEVTPLLTLQAIGALSADVHQALDAAAEGEMDPSDFLAAVRTAAYLTTWSQKLVESRLGEIAAQLQFDQDTAQRWAVQSYGSQNTLMGDSPAAAAFQLMKAAEPAKQAAAAAPPSWSKNVFKGSGGRGRGRTGDRGGRNTPRAEQVTGPGADKASGRPQ
jgi:hypothetical protein